MDRVFAEHRPDWVSHQGAQTSVSKSTREPLLDAAINVMGTLHVLRASVRHEIQRLVFASTGGAIYGEVPEGERATTAWMPQPISPYACSKLAGEAYLGAFSSEFGLPTQILRYANVYGPRQDPHGETGVIAIFSNRLLEARPLTIFGDGEQTRDYVNVADVVSANLCAADMEVPVPSADLDDVALNVGTGAETSVNRLADLLEQVSGRAHGREHRAARAGELRRSALDSSRLRGLGWLPRRTLEEGLRETFAHFAVRKEEALEAERVMAR